MALGKRTTASQDDLFLTHDQLPKSPGHAFYRQLNEVLANANFDPWLEQECAPYYSQLGRSSIPPGVYFRMLMVGYFEGISSQRGIAWRCCDSLSIREFLGVPITQDTPDHSSLTNTRQRLPLELHQKLFAKMIELLHQHSLIKGHTVGVDSTTLEANAALKSIVRRADGQDYEAYVTELMRAAGELEADEIPSTKERIQFDKKRKNKTFSNDEWQSPVDPDASIARMKDGTTHLAYKAEHVVDLETNAILAAEIYANTESDHATIEDSLTEANANLQHVEPTKQINEVTADTGYHSNAVITTLTNDWDYRTYIPEADSQHNRVWTNKPPEQKRCVENNRRRCERDKGKQLQRERGEKVERTFAHLCETGGCRRTWIRGREEVQKRYLISALTHNLGLILRKVFGHGTPRSLQGSRASGFLFIYVVYLFQLAIYGFQQVRETFFKQRYSIRQKIRSYRHNKILVLPA